MTITGQSSLSKDEIERMVRDAESNAAEDRRRREEAEIRNQAETLIYQTEKVLRDQGNKLAPEERANVEAKVAELRTALNGSDNDAITRANEALMTVSQQFTQKLYESAAAESAAAGAASSGSKDDEVVDAEIIDEGV